MTGKIDFDSSFAVLTGHPPFPWQRALFSQFLHGEVRKRCDLPTGLGKTSVIPIWVLALAEHVLHMPFPNFPRRLVYVVNRRTVVDQATRDAERIRSALVDGRLPAVAAALAGLAGMATDVPLAISTLRGQFADNAEWRDDPARPAVIVGTIDMIGSRLLFSGYGRGFKSRPLHAGFLGQDVLLVHDEAHLEPAFQELAITIEKAQQGHDIRPVRVMALSATSRQAGEDEKEVFRLTAADWKHPVAARRLRARKAMSVIHVEDSRKLASEVSRLAARHENSGQAILVFLRRLEDVDAVTALLQHAAPGRVQTLTGTLRGRERDRLATEDPVFARFIRKGTGAGGTVYLVCTSAGEVGVDMSADDMVCDLTPFDSMAQRLGRVNRFGDGDATIDVIHPSVSTQSKAKFPTPYNMAVARTLTLFEQLPTVDGTGRRDASPASLMALPEEARLAAFSPEPRVLAATDILFDKWALTTCTGELPGRPPVADWLHGEAEWEPPSTFVAWREEVALVTGDVAVLHNPEELLDDFPLEPHELLRDQSDRVRAQLESLARAAPDLPVWIQRQDGTVRTVRLGQTVQVDSRGAAVIRLDHCTVILPPAAGGLRDGRLDGSAARDTAGGVVYDVSCEGRTPDGTRRRFRVWDDEAAPDGMRLLRRIDTRPDGWAEEGDESVEGRRVWRWYVQPRAAQDAASRSARQEQLLQDHTNATVRAVEAFASRLGLGEDERAAIRFAAQHHDDGKARGPWQRSVGNPDYPTVTWAKSSRGTSRPSSPYRHEFGSLADVQCLSDVEALSPAAQDLALHLIAAHHGRARPHFPEAEVLDPGRTMPACEELAREVPRRFARLQRKYGRWGLAWLESLVRAADAEASKAADEALDSPAGTEPERGEGRR